MKTTLHIHRQGVVQRIRYLFGSGPASMSLDAGWTENDHPRGKGGKFTSGSGSANASAPTTAQKRLRRVQIGTKGYSGKLSTAALEAAKKVEAKEAQAAKPKAEKKAPSAPKKPKESTAKFPESMTAKPSRRRNGEESPVALKTEEAPIPKKTSTAKKKAPSKSSEKAVNSKGEQKAEGKTVSDDHIHRYNQKLEHQLKNGSAGDFEKVFDELKADKSMGAPEMKALCKQFSGGTASSKKRALEMIWARHQSLEGLEAAMRATNGRTAA